MILAYTPTLGNHLPPPAKSWHIIAYQPTTYHSLPNPIGPFSPFYLHFIAILLFTLSKCRFYDKAALVTRLMPIGL